MRTSTPRRWPVLVVCIPLAGCAFMPASGPSASAFSSGSGAGEASAFFHVVPVSGAVLRLLTAEVPPTFRDLPAANRATPAALGAGDVVAVTVFEADIGGLFSSAGVAGGGSPMTRLPDQTIGPDGAVTIPYAGRVRVAGLLPGEAERRIAAALNGRAIEPQAIVTLAGGTGRVVSVAGDAVAGRQVIVPAGGMRLLEAVAAAGGTSLAASEISVRLTRGGATRQLPFAAVVANPAENVPLAPGDVLLLTREARTIVVLGAFGRNADVALTGESTTLAEVLARAGGLDALQADAGGVFLLRDLRKDEAARLGLAVVPGSGAVAVAFRFDLSKPDGLLLARRFMVRDGDALFSATAPLATLRNTLTLARGIGGPALEAVSAF